MLLSSHEMQMQDYAVHFVFAKQFLCLYHFSKFTEVCILTVLKVLNYTVFPSLQFIQTFINETFMERYDAQLEDYQVTLIWSIIVSIFSFGGLTGALIAGPMTIYFGR